MNLAVQTLLVTTACYVVPGLAAFVVVFVASKFKLKKTDLLYAKNALVLAKLALGEKLGPKSKFVIDAWLDGIDAISDGNFTGDEALDHFVRSINAAAQTNGVVLTDEELKNIRTIASSVLGMIDLKKKPTVVAMQMMMVNE